MIVPNLFHYGPPMILTNSKAYASISISFLNTEKQKMTELLDHQIYEETEVSAMHDAAVSHLADIAVESSMPQEQAARDIEIDGKKCQTTLPEGCNPFINTPGAEDLSLAVLAPSRLDQIPVGKYSVIGNGYNSETQQNGQIERIIEIYASEVGLAIDPNSFVNTREWIIRPENSELFSALGYEFGDEQVVNGYLMPTGVPLPETIVASAGKHGLEIQLFAEDGLISPKNYLKAFSDRKYPVSAGTEGFYRHDISDTHLEVMILGGDDLKDLLSATTTQALQGDDESIGKAAGAIDRYTEALSDIYDELGYCHEDAVLEGEKVGIARVDTERIITVLQEKAKKFGILPKPELDARPENQIRTVAG